MKLACSLLFWTLLLRAAQAQVTVQVLIPPPYSPFIYNYQQQFSGTNAIVLTNTAKTPTSVVLRGELTGRKTGLRIYTSPNYQLKHPVNLNGGETRSFNLGDDNQDYFDPKNLEVSGAGVDASLRNQILTTGLLPADSYDLCVLAYHYDAGRAVGTGTPFKGCAFLTISYLEPPRLIQPACGREVLIRPNEPIQTVFTWNPPVGNLSGAQVVYDFYLVKVPPGQNPNDAINNAIDRRVGNPFIERDLTTTFFNYGVAEPALTEGQYAWRVIAHDPNRQVVFQNQGRSEYCSFTARNIAGPPVNAILVQVPGAQKPPIPTGPMNVMELVAAGCKDVAAPADKTPLAAADNYLNQTVKIGNFDLTIDDVTMKDDAYSGKGRVTWNGVPIRVSFTSIQINAQKQVIAGLANGLDEAFRMPGVNLGSTNLGDLQQLDGDKLITYVDNLKNNLFGQAKSALAVPLPLGYDTGSGLIGINYMRFTPTGADMGMIFNMKLPEANSYLALAGVGICMAPDKLVPTNALLYLLKDLEVPFTPLTFIKGNPSLGNPTGTFAEITRDDGLKRIHGELELNLGSGFLQLDDGNGKTKPGDVTATLKADFTNWADWIAEVQMPPAFGLSPLSGFTLKGVSIQYDHSDLRNPAGFAPPAEYKGESGLTFQGIYIAEMQVLLPKAFLGQKGNRTGFAARGCLFTNGEFTGRLTPATKPLLDYNTGSLGTWGFSIDEFEVLIVQNRFERGGMNGKIQFPISTDYFTYSTTLRDNFSTLQFLVKPKSGGYTVPLWAANMTLAESSHILVGLKDGNPLIDMQLAGNLLLDTGHLPKVVPLVLPNMYFENFIVSNQNKPDAAGGGGVYVNPGNWKLVGGIFKDEPSSPPPPGARKGGGPAEPELLSDMPEELATAPGNEGGLAGFSIEIAPPKVVVEGRGFGIELGAYVSLSDGSANIMGASGFVRILGKIDLVGNRPKPVFGGVYPTRFTVKGDFGAGSVDAAIDVYDQHEKYGTGFKGVGKVNIPSLAEVEATVQFGKVRGFYYAYADASVIISGGIPIAPPTPLVLNGLKGGFYYNMAPDNPAPVTSIADQPAPNSPTTGYTNSKTGYTPVRNGWGIKAGVFLAMTDRHMMISLVEVEASFNGSALRTFSLSGKANIMDTDGDLDTRKDAMVTAGIDFKHDVVQKSYTFSVDVDGQWPAGPLLVPVQIPIRAYFDPNKYHVKLGDPFAQRIEASLLNMDPPGGLIKAKLLANAYVAFGNDLPGMPPLPQRVDDFLGTGENPTNAAAAQDQRQGVFNRVAESANPKSISGGFTVLLGAGVKADLKVNAFPLTINAGGDIGFDAALFYNAKCKDPDVAVPGLFGWYGQADLYAYLFGGIDIEVDLFGISGRYRLCGLEAGALLRGGVPNPAWAEGKVRAKGEILDGWVSFDASANVAFGDKCVPQYTGDPLAKLVIIEELRPKGDKSVDTDATMSAVFNVSMNQEYPILLPDNTMRTYRFGLGSYSLTYLDKAGKRQPFTGLAAPIWANNDQLLLLPVNSGQLPGTRPHLFTVTATIEEKGPSGSFTFVTTDGNQRTETKSVAFTTNPQPDEIRLKDIAYQYPLDGQLYCLKGQVPKGLIAGPLPNEALEKPNARYEAVFVPKEPGPSLRVPFVYQTGNARYPSKVVFAFAPGLQNEKTYRLELHRITQATFFDKTAITLNQGQSGNQLQNTAKNAIQGTATVRANTLGATEQLRGNAVETDKILYSFAFRTSRYNTFAEKMAALRFSPTSYSNGTNPARADYLTFELEPAGSIENFEDTELFGYKSAKQRIPALLQSRPLVPIATTYPYEAWVTNTVYNPLLRFNLLGRVDLSFTLFTEMNGGGWLLNFPAAAMQNKRSRFGMTMKAGSTLTSISGLTQQGGSANTSVSTTSTGRQAGLASSITATPLLGGQPATTGMKLATSSSAIQLASMLFPLNEEPDRWYKFFVQRDRISFFDWQAVNQLGTNLYSFREQVRKLNKSSWSDILQGVTLSSSSPTLTLSATYGGLDEMPNELIDRYPVTPGMFSTNQFKQRSAGSTSGVMLRYVPYPDGPQQEVQKEFSFKGNTTPIATPR